MGPAAEPTLLGSEWLMRAGLSMKEEDKVAGEEDEELEEEKGGA